jgi:hypothetical protein
LTKPPISESLSEAFARKSVRLDELEAALIRIRDHSRHDFLGRQHDFKGSKTVCPMCYAAEVLGRG